MAILGLKTYGNKAFTWVNKTKDVWVAEMQQVFGTSEMIGSTFQTHNSSKEDQVSWSNRCCAQPSVTTAGLLLLLVRFTCTKHKKQGKLCQDGARGQAVVLLKSLLSEMGPMILTIVMTQYYRWHHPRPAASDLLTADKVQLNEGCWRNS